MLIRSVLLSALLALSVLDPDPDLVRIRPDSTLSWTPAKTPYVSLFHSDHFPREYYLYIRPGKKIRLDLSELDAGQQENVWSEIRRLSAYWQMEDDRADSPVLSFKRNAPDHQFRIPFLDRVLVVRKTKTATQPVRCVLEYEMDGRIQKDSLALDGYSSIRFSSDRPVLLHSVVLYEPDLYNHPSVISGITVGEKTFRPAFTFQDGKTIGEDFPFIQSSARLMFTRPVRIWKDTPLSCQVSVLDTDAQLVNTNPVLVLCGPEGWTRTLPLWLLLLGAIVSVLVVTVLSVALLSRRGNRSSANSLQVRMLKRERSSLSQANSKLTSDNDNLAREKQGLLVENGELKASLQSQNSRLAEKEASLAKLTEALKNQEEKQASASVSIPLGQELVSLLGDFFHYLQEISPGVPDPLLRPLILSWNRFIRDFQPLTDGHDPDTAAQVLMDYLENEDSFLNGIVRLRAYMEDGELSSFLEGRGIARSTVWLISRLVEELLREHAITLKTAPSLFSDVFDSRYEPASGHSPLLAVRPLDDAVRRPGVIFDIGRAGFVFKEKKNTRFSVYYYVAPQF